jgi:hypothetical protein
MLNWSNAEGLSMPRSIPFDYTQGKQHVGEITRW